VKKVIFLYFIDSKFLASQEIVWTIACGFFFWGLHSFYLSYFIFEKQTKTIFIISIFCICLNLVLNYIMVPKYGTIGAGYATLATYFFGGTITCFLFLFSLRPKLLVKYGLNKNN
jgi:O-antigen/teichoic acid export membrane protein